MELKLPPGLDEAMADESLLRHILTNLLNNAVKYSEPKGSVMLNIASLASQVELRVKDTGVGIPPEVLPDVFDLFTQVNRTLDRSQGGLGIGLALVRKLVELHGGTVEAQSEGIDRGSEFIVRLPMIVPSDASSRR